MASSLPLDAASLGLDMVNVDIPDAIGVPAVSGVERLRVATRDVQ